MTDYEDYQIAKYSDNIYEEFETAKEARARHWHRGIRPQDEDWSMNIKPYEEFTYEEIFDEDGEITPEFDIAQWRRIRELLNQLDKGIAIMALEDAVRR